MTRSAAAALAAALALTASLAAPLAAQGALTDGEHTVVLNGVRHWYRVAGAARGGTPLVVVHGGPGGNVYAFERIAGRRLETRVPVVYYEQRGSGRSAAPADTMAYGMPLLVADLEALRRHLGLERIVPLGFSFGGELALEYALAHPDRVERLVLEAPSTGDWDRMFRVHIAGFAVVADSATRARIAAIERSGEPLDRRWERVWAAAGTPEVDRLLFRDSAAARRNRALWTESGLRNTGAMFRALRAQPRTGPSLLERARALRRPVLVLVGLWDRNVGVDAVRDLADVLPAAELVVFERSAHFPDIEEPDRFAEMVLRFLGR